LGGKYFDFPKSLYLVEDILKLTTDKSSLILDFFSGSGTTAHATMQLNAEDGGNRPWIMIQLPEEIDEKSEAFKAGYRTIPEISRERIRRAGDKIIKERPNTDVDFGFRTLKVSDTNYKEVYKPAGEYQQSTMLDVVDNIKDGRTDLDLLYGVLTQTAFELNKPLEIRNISGSTIYLYDYFSEASGLIACFSNNISEDAIKVIAELKPLTAIFRDSSFANSQAKVNLSEHFRVLSPDTKIKVI
jgi:adenine-specific DNA-methyltransferase